MQLRGSHFYDVTLPLTPDLPVWPGDDDISVTPLARIASGDTTNVSALSFTSHVGTHVDAPWHFIDEGAKLNDLALDRWVGPCFVVQIPDEAKTIEPDLLEAAGIPD